MKHFNKEQLDILSEYEQNFFRAVHQDYYRTMRSTVIDKLSDIYNSVADKPYNTNWSCSHCILAFLKTIGKKYYDDLELYKENSKKLIEAIDEVMAEVEDDDENNIKEDKGNG